MSQSSSIVLTTIDEAVTVIKALAAQALTQAKALDRAGQLADHAAEPGRGADLFNHVVELQAAARAHFGSDKAGFRIIGPNWLRNFGQIAHLHTYFKMKALGMLEATETVICLDGIEPANMALLNYFAPFAKRVVTHRNELGDYASHFELLEESPVSLWLASGRASHLHGKIYETAQRWLAEGRPPLLSLAPDHRAAGRRWLSQRGVPDGAWFVTFHARDLAWQSLRSVREESYFPAMHSVIAAGGWVVCMGVADPPPHPRIVKLDRREKEDDWLDVFLLAGCRFFVGCGSGPSQVPYIFGVPSAMANACQLGSQTAALVDLFMPKLFRSRWTGSVVSLEDVLSHFTTACAGNVASIESLDLDVIDNSAEEIEEMTIEMIERLDNRSLPPSHEEEAAQERLRALRQFPSMGDGPVVGSHTRLARGFLKRHGEALGLMADPVAA